MLRSRFLWKLYAGYVAVITVMTAIVGIMVERRIEEDSLQEMKEALRANAVLLRELALPFLSGPVDPALQKKVAELAALIESQAANYPRDEIVVLANPSKFRVAGNLATWPAEVPESPGTYGLVINQPDASMRVVASHTTLPGGYHLLMGRESARFQSLVDYFWFGISAATAIVLMLGTVLGWMIRRRSARRNALDPHDRPLLARRFG